MQASEQRSVASLSGRRSARLLSLLVVVATVVGPALPAAAEDLPLFTGDEFADMFNTATLDNLAPIGPAPSINGNSSIDARIRTIGESRGYLRRPLPAGSLAKVDGYSMQASAAEAWRDLKAAARAAGHTLVLTSTYRSHATQTAVLMKRLTSFSDAAIDYRLRWAAVPGYSKHHTGYAIDVTQSGYRFTSFRSTPAYQWLSASNYENAKRHGWIPSYPPEASPQGPQPEAWEFTYVGADNIWCYGFTPTADNTFCDDRVSVFEEDIEWMVAEGLTSGCNALGDRFCPNQPVTRAQLAAFLHRALADVIVPGGETISFADTVDSAFKADIEWLAATGITKGCSTDMFCPETPVTRGQLAAFLVRAMGYSDSGDGDLFKDDDDSIFEDQIDRLAVAGVTTGCNPPDNDEFCPAGRVTRGQVAAFLHRALGAD
jgi:hypothetical protein